MQLVVLFCLFVGLEAFAEDAYIEMWDKFQTKYDKFYPSTQKQKRFVIFKENMRQIKAHNNLHAKGLVSYTKGINKFSDMTFEEFMKRGFHLEGKSNHKVFKASSRHNLPDYVNWRESDAVGPAKDQGDCGSSWAFSACGAMEAQAKLVNHETIYLSEQNLMDCAGNTYENYACDGGLMENAFRYVIDHGLMYDEEYPYEAKYRNCTQTKRSFNLTDYADISPGEKNLQAALATIGPISAFIDVTPELQSYTSGILYDKNCSEDFLDQAVLVVGYGSENGTDYWLVRNSWGEDWGENGYFRLARNRENNCGIASLASYPVL